ncbi:MAG: LAGLIDADG family homing endonuclease, partial [Candidatus Nanohaloarchaea archaeon]
DLREEGFTNETISDRIDARIDSYLYNDYKMSIDSFEKLIELYGSEIEHELVPDQRFNQKQLPPIEKSIDLAELFGIILGDGHVQFRSEKNKDRNTSTYFISITLNEKEKELIKHSKDLSQSITSLEPKEYTKSGRCVRIVLHSKDLVTRFVELGLKAGNKKENQVHVPEWIKEEKKFCRACVRGLIDTDGAIYQDQRGDKSYTRVQFKNYSEPLLEDFKQMCEKLDIKTVKGGPHQIQISRHDIEKFIKTIQPTKANSVTT